MISEHTVLKCPFCMETTLDLGKCDFVNRDGCADYAIKKVTREGWRARWMRDGWHIACPKCVDVLTRCFEEEMIEAAILNDRRRR